MTSKNCENMRARMNATNVQQERKLFLSYAWIDKSLARRVARRLGHRGFNVWLDEQQMQPGEELPRRIQEAIRSCRHLLVLLTTTSATSKWVLKEIAFAHKLGSRIAIVPLIAESNVQSPLLDENLGMDVSDTSSVEDALDQLAEVIDGKPGPTARDADLLEKDLEQLAEEVPLLSTIRLSDAQSYANFDAIAVDQSTMHEVETFVAIQWDLAVAQAKSSQSDDSTSSSAIPSSDKVAYAAADLFHKHGLGYYALNRFVETCKDWSSVHNMLSRLTDSTQQSNDSREKVRQLLAKAQQPQHTALRWFVLREFGHLSEKQKSWAIAHFVRNASSPENDAILTAFAFFKLMPENKALENLWSTWALKGLLADPDSACIFFGLMNDAAAEGLKQFDPCIKVFRDHFRNLARGRKLEQRLAAADLLVYAQREHYVLLKELCEELGNAPYRAEWKELKLPAELTSAFVDIARAVERGDDAHPAWLRLHGIVRTQRLR